MKHLRLHDLVLCLPLVLLGCARASVLDDALANEIGEYDAAIADSPVAPPKPGNPETEDEPSRPAADVRTDAARPTPPRDDAGLDASAGKDAATSTSADASKDALPDATSDAAVPTTPPVMPPPTTPDASTNAPTKNACDSDSDCHQSCVPAGILSCCRDNGSCGCTWAPGSYCI